MYFMRRFKTDHDDVARELPSLVGVHAYQDVMALRPSHLATSCTDSHD